jgi:hypothetical protein
MSFLVSVYNYPTLSLDKLIVKYYIELGVGIKLMEEPAVELALTPSPFWLLSRSHDNNCSGKKADRPAIAQA